MIDSISSGSSSRPHVVRGEVKFEGLTQRRAEEGRRIALAATQAEHQDKVRMAVEKYMRWPNEAGANSPVSLADARKAYSDF